MSITNEVREFLVDEVRKALQTKKDALMAKVRPVLEQYVDQLRQREDMLDLQKGIWAYDDLSKKLEELHNQRNEIEKRIERDFNTLAKLYHTRELDLGSTYYYKQTSTMDRYGGYQSECIKFDSAAANAQDAFQSLLTAMCLDEALDTTGMREEIKAVDNEFGTTKRKIFLAMNMKALRTVAGELSALGIEVTF